MNQTEQNKSYLEDEITLKDIVLKIKEFCIEYVLNWKICSLIILFFVSFSVFNAITTPTTYRATLTFMVNEYEGGGGLAGVSAILGQFGLGGGNNSKHNLQKILELSKSRRIVRECLFKKVYIDSLNDYIANHIIRKYNYHDEWKKINPILDGFLFSKKIVEQFSIDEKRIFKALFGKIVGGTNHEGLVTCNFNEKTGIMNISTKSISEELSIETTVAIFESLSQFYVSKTIEKQKQTYDLVKNKVDSLKQTLNSTQIKALRFEDNNLRLINRESEFQKLALEQEIQKLIIAYGESYKNLEIADFSLKNKTPFIQIIDKPIKPITPTNESKFRALILGILLGLVISVLFVAGKMFLKKISIMSV